MLDQLIKIRAEIDSMIESLRDVPTADRVLSLNEKILKIASMQLGVKERVNGQENPKVVEYHKFASIKNDKAHPAEVPWCSSFLCYVVEKAGLESTNSLAARSWLKWGESSMALPVPGDIAVFWRVAKNSWQGHCGIYLRTNADDSVVVLGGNQNDEVNVTSYSGSKLLDIRRHKMLQLSNVDQSILSDFAHSLINGKVIGRDEKVS